MSKPTTFLWAWNGYSPQPDKLMTRARAAVLLRSWRRNTKGKNNLFVLALKMKRIAPHTYQAKCSGETGTLYIIRA